MHPAHDDAQQESDVHEASSAAMPGAASALRLPLATGWDIAQWYFCWYLAPWVPVFVIKGDDAKAAPPKRGEWDGAEPLWRWVIRLRDGSRHILQTGESRKEKGFLRISCEIARRYLTLHAGPSEEGRSAEGVAKCESCGGQLPVGERQAVSCEFCGALVPGSQPAWSPDSVHFAFVSHGQIFTTERGPVPLSRLTDGPCPTATPTYSPDGQYLAFVVTCGGSLFYRAPSGLFVISAQGGASARLIAGDVTVGSPVWQGDSIYFSVDWG